MGRAREGGEERERKRRQRWKEGSMERERLGKIERDDNREIGGGESRT